MLCHDDRYENIIRLTGFVDVTDSWIILDYFELEEEVESTIAQTTISETTDKESKTQKITNTISSDKKKITYNIKNKKVKIKSAKYRNKKILLKYKRVKGAKGYQIRYSTSKRFKKSKTINTKKMKYTIRKIRKKKYYIKVRAFALHKGKKVFGQWSRRKIVKAKFPNRK